MNYELKARELHKLGNTCSNSLYMTFKDDLNLVGEVPKPRSRDGLCGTILTVEFILKQIGKEDYYDEFKELFLREFGYLKCLDLMKNRGKCNDYVGFSAKYISNILE